MDEYEEIKNRAIIFVNDNFKNPRETNYLIIQQAMLIGFSIAIELQTAEIRAQVK